MNINSMIHKVGVAFGIVAGLGTIVAGIVMKQVAFGAWGVALLASAIIAAASGARATPGGSISGPSVKATFTRVPEAAIFAMMGLLAVAMILTFVFPPWA